MKITSIGAAALLVAAGATNADIISLVSDHDNYGYGGTSTPPCEFYDHTEPEDMGVFDRELSGGDEVDKWVHSFDLGGQTIVSAVLVIPERFTDNNNSTISFDGVSQGFAGGVFAACGEIVRMFSIDPSMLDDGELVVVFTENGDDVSFDYAELQIETIPAPASALLLPALGLIAGRRRR